ncbi:hypothetical protein K490DRAFT_56021 [Saccharata proteae CBS 121410]|uniref:Uncharacterized protein n=1 Tax=Saccharata proteae CBS 121410 TaxID=1314787 RepID=A0A9P4HZC0_9PEZI|nr:hypothetical protein K490DRAFT_56021 [Saccharata proteae CBS 121410]
MRHRNFPGPPATRCIVTFTTRWLARSTPYKLPSQAPRARAQSRASVCGRLLELVRDEVGERDVLVAAEVLVRVEGGRDVSRAVIVIIGIAVPSPNRSESGVPTAPRWPPRAKPVKSDVDSRKRAGEPELTVQRAESQVQCSETETTSSARESAEPRNNRHALHRAKKRSSPMFLQAEALETGGPGRRRGTASVQPSALTVHSFMWTGGALTDDTGDDLNPLAGDRNSLLIVGASWPMPAGHRKGCQQWPSTGEEVRREGIDDR